MEIKKPTISAVIIAKDEAARISDCIARLSWTDEIIVIDNGSRDKTRDIARRLKAKVTRVSGGSFSLLRNRGAAMAKGTWILYVDADEWMTKELSTEIQTIVSGYTEGQPVAYFIQRKNYYLGELWPTHDRMERLFLKKHLISWKGDLHETPEVRGARGMLKEPLIHTTHRTLEEMVAKTNTWSFIEAKLRYQSGHPPIVAWRLLRVMITGFYTSFISQQGFRAGTVGFIESMYQAFSLFITYAKLWELQQQKKKNLEATV